MNIAELEGPTYFLMFVTNCVIYCCHVMYSLCLAKLDSWSFYFLWVVLPFYLVMRTMVRLAYPSY